MELVEPFVTCDIPLLITLELGSVNCQPRLVVVNTSISRILINVHLSHKMKIPISNPKSSCDHEAWAKRQIVNGNLVILRFGSHDRGISRTWLLYTNGKYK